MYSNGSDLSSGKYGNKMEHNLEINKRYKGQKDAFRKTSANEVSFLKFSQNIR